MIQLVAAQRDWPFQFRRTDYISPWKFAGTSQGPLSGCILFLHQFCVARQLQQQSIFLFWIYREIIDHMESDAGNFIQILIGPRQAGKSSVLGYMVLAWPSEVSM